MRLTGFFFECCGRHGAAWEYRNEFLFLGGGGMDKLVCPCPCGVIVNCERIPCGKGLE